MSVKLTDVSSGYSTGVINDNFKKLEDYINNQLLNRDITDIGEPNHMEGPLDMNSNLILNIGVDSSNPESLLTVNVADSRYVNTAGDIMQGVLDMGNNPLKVREAQEGYEPARKDELDLVKTGYISADANLQQQLTGNAPLEASAFSPISWHAQSINNSVEIPANKNAWTFGPDITIAAGQTVTVGEGSYWTLAEGTGESASLSNYDEGTL